MNILKTPTRPRPIAGAIAMAAALLGSHLLLAADSANSNASPGITTESPKVEGTWKWTFAMPDGTLSKPRAKLKREGNTVTGTSVVSAGSETAIHEGRVDGDQVSWTVVREHAGRKVTTRYSGKISGQTLKGTIQSDWTGEVRSYPWEAQRASDSPAGTWKWEFTFGRGGGRGGGGGGRPGADAGGAGPGGRGGRGGRGGFRFESRMTLKYDNGKLTGKVKGRSSDTEITNAKFENGKIAFEVERERDGTVYVTKYRGTLDGDTIKGKSEFDLGEGPRTADWEATRVEE